MPKEKKKQYKNKSTKNQPKRTYTKRKKKQSHAVDPILSKGVLSTVLIIFAIIAGLSLFDSAGDGGEMIHYGLSAVFGVSKYAFPAVLVIFAWFVIRDTDYNYKSTHTLGALLFFLSFSSLFHLHFPLSDMFREALEGNGGGLFGMLAWPTKRYLGDIAGYVILVGLVWISLLFLFNTAVTHFILVHKKLMQSLGSVGKGITSMVRSLFITSEDGEGDEDEYGEEQSDEEEDYIEPLEKKSFAPAMREDSFDDLEDEEAPAPQTPRTPEPTTTKVSLKDQGKPGVDQADYMKNIVIKKIPAINLLSSERSNPTSGDVKANEEIIRRTFSDFNIDVHMGKVRVGPTVTQYTLKPPSGVKLSKITTLSNNLALALAVHPIRIEAPIPGKSLVGIEVPNEKAAQVTLKELIESKAFKTREHNMMIALGRDVAGKVWFADLPKMPHLLIAGSTGSGKSVCMNTIIMSLLYQNTAESLRFIMVDPKRVELTPYNGIPHLLTPVITDVPKTVNALKWTVGEMDRRFDLLSKVKNKDITTYNKAHPDSKLPHIVFIIDELADLMQMASNEVEGGIIRLAQMARAVGIHIIVATQRPSVDVITGLMKANIPGRIAFSVASATDSRTIIDSSGAESLLGKGDMLLSTAALSKPMRIQGAFVSEKEARNVIDYLRVDDEESVYDNAIVTKQDGGSQGNLFGGSGDDHDALFDEAKALVIEAGKASASYLQRRLRVGYARAARLLDELEMAGIVGPADGSKPREILATVETLEQSMDMGGELNAFKSDTLKIEEDPADNNEPEEDAIPHISEFLDTEAFGISEEEDEDAYNSEDVVEEATTHEEEDANEEQEDMLDDETDTDTTYEESDDAEEEIVEEEEDDEDAAPQPRRDLFR